ncbi:Similar to ATPase-like protein [Adineta vaga]; acc. no. ACD54603 [Pyronema omphalodes CBS 100304]|uniref:Similar to ATPase-like protein [Adineta vaga] acc. no. ACD54603 n=1 Tax=Pyronema omphalodes (strain CBS 100304) TaxID=1076935 RepID=U4L3V7_PYROM|nr:Similar to ATPase-like protein [Adineta vaga]; acc. no. ACD54603 [Pyronema omphalodes CBS 100304]
MFIIIPPLFIILLFAVYHYIRPTRTNSTYKHPDPFPFPKHHIYPPNGHQGSKSPSHEPQRPRRKTPLQQQLASDKALYYQLQNFQDYPEVLPVARKRLLELINHCIQEVSKLPDQDKAKTILSIPSFDAEALKNFLQAQDDITTARFQEYLKRRKDGGEREMFKDRSYAEYWIRQSAPVKYVDGSWLGGVHRVTTRPQERRWTKTAWQILSEELGDGDLEKNHVAVYERLVHSVGGKGRGDEKEFVESGNRDARVWTAAVAQLAVSLESGEFLPEVLGFNMAYEALPFHLLVTNHELKELSIDPYYFLLHIVIDNNDSGHSAMGREAVVGLINSAPNEVTAQALWRRVQAGFILAEGLPTTPTPHSPTILKLLEIFDRKAITAKPMHIACPAKIGGKNGKTISEWLDPEKYHSHCHDFLIALAESRWITPGEPEESRLLQELKWGGRMFGAFTNEEVVVLRAWIEELGDQTYLVPKPTTVMEDYQKFIGRGKLPRAVVKEQMPVQVQLVDAPKGATEAGNKTEIPLQRALSLLILAAAPFEYLPSNLVMTASPNGMAAIKVLRALYGFLPETEMVAGMDEVHRGEPLGVVEISQRLGGRLDESDGLVRVVMGMSRMPRKYWWELVGVQMGLVEGVMKERVWREYGVEKELVEELGQIAGRVRGVLRSSVEKAGKEERERVRRGQWVVMEALQKGRRRSEVEREC